MKKLKFCITILSSFIILSSCTKFTEGISVSKRSKSSDEFLVYKKKPLVVPPDFDKIPSPKPILEKEKKLSESNTSIEDLLDLEKNEGDEVFESEDNNSLEQSILKKIKKN